MIASAPRSGTGEAPCPDPFDTLAPVYDRLTAGWPYDCWLARIERLAIEHGLTGRRVLDVGCGTGSSFLPLLDRGYEVSACDASEAMVEIARAKAGEPGERIFRADVRSLPDIGGFDLVTCLGATLNHLLYEHDLGTALEEIARVLRPGGIAVLDLNTLRTYRTTFASTLVSESGDAYFCWRGECAPSFEPHEMAAASLDAFVAEGRESWRRLVAHLEQRHHPRDEVESACLDAGLEIAGVYGQVHAGRLVPRADELAHDRLVYFARRAGGSAPAGVIQL
ncbi:MAG: methyltransferase domain-containing protein [Thermoleophilaceae bacterium]|nr:methyltransferase domain-containing protein [Thermoleophilaceae bacterium]